MYLKNVSSLFDAPDNLTYFHAPTSNNSGFNFGDVLPWGLMEGGNFKNQPLKKVFINYVYMYP